MAYAATAPASTVVERTCSAATTPAATSIFHERYKSSGENPDGSFGFESTAWQYPLEDVVAIDIQSGLTKVVITGSLCPTRGVDQEQHAHMTLTSRPVKLI